MWSILETTADIFTYRKNLHLAGELNLESSELRFAIATVLTTEYLLICCVDKENSLIYKHKPSDVLK